MILMGGKIYGDRSMEYGGGLEGVEMGSKVEIWLYIVFVYDSFNE